MIAVVASAAVFAFVQRNATPSVTALTVRAEFARTSLRMLASAPLFGIGVGEYFAKSREFSSPALLELYPVSHENAHNNFLQILAELGVVGFGAFIWVLATAGAACVRRLSANPNQGLLWAGATGLLVFTITWLAGHPLLLDAPAFSFWLLLGAVAGWQTMG